MREGAGDRFEDIELQIRVFFPVVTDNRDELVSTMAAGVGLSAEQALESPLALVGTTDQIIETIRERRERFGFSYVVIGQAEIEDFAPVVAELAGT